MKVVKHIGCYDVVFEGEERAVNAFTAIHGALSGRGYGIYMPREVGESNDLLVPGVGEVRIIGTDRHKDFKKVFVGYSVELVHGRFASWLMHLLD